MSKIRKEEEQEAPVMPGEINRDAVTAAGKNLSMAKGILNNMNYDTFKQGSIYDGLRRSYEQQGKTAMKDVLGQVAARTGGMASSYAVSAANQSYNNYMKGLEDAARAMYNEEYAKNRDKVDLAQREYDTAYGMYRDDTADAWNRYNAERNAFVSDRDHNYRVSRDTKADNDAAKEDEINTLSTDAYYGKAVSWQEYLKAHPNTQLSESDYNSIVSAATGRRADENRTNVDAEFESMFGAEGFVWGDWNEDGVADEKDAAFAPDFSTSSYGEDYWEQYYKDAQQGYADADTKAAQDEVIEILKAGGTPDTQLLIDAGWLTANDTVTDENKDGIPDTIPAGLTGAARTLWQNNIDSKTEADTKAAQDDAVNDINARIANGESLYEIKKAYEIDGTSRTWESVTGMSEAEWQQRFNDNQTKNYAYPNTNAGRADIIDTWVDSASFSLSDKDQKNFNFIFGDDKAYENVQTYIKNLTEIDPRTMTADEFSDAMASLEASLPTNMTTEQIDEFIKKANPEAWKAVSDKTYFDPKKPLNGGILNGGIMK